MNLIPTRLACIWKVIGWMLVILVVYLSLTPSPVEFPVEEGDRYEHALAYATLMFWFAHLHDGFRARVGLALGLIALGVGLEFVQRMTGYRSFQLADMLADAVGVGIGWLVAPPRLPHTLRAIAAYWSEMR
jgi:VanZ family protein